MQADEFCKWNQISAGLCDILYNNTTIQLDQLRKHLKNLKWFLCVWCVERGKFGQFGRVFGYFGPSLCLLERALLSNASHSGLSWLEVSVLLLIKWSYSVCVYLHLYTLALWATHSVCHKLAHVCTWIRFYGGKSSTHH